MKGSFNDGLGAMAHNEIPLSPKLSKPLKTNVEALITRIGIWGLHIIMIV